MKAKSVIRTEKMDRKAISLKKFHLDIEGGGAGVGDRGCGGGAYVAAR